MNLDSDADAPLGGPAAPSPAPRAPAPQFALPEPARWMLEVRRSDAVTPSVRRLAFGASPIEDAEASPARPRTLDYAPGQDLALVLPGTDAGPIARRYTISGSDRAAGVVEIEAVVHGDGPGARFLGATAPGDRLEAIGPRGKITLVEGVATHLFLGDEASLPAIASMVAALGPGAHAIVVAEVEGPDERRVLDPPTGARLELTWLERGGADPADPARVLAVLEGLDFDAEGVHAYVFGEFHVVQAARRLLGGRLDRSRISPKPYWRADLANAGHGEPVRDA